MISAVTDNLAATNANVASDLTPNETANATGDAARRGADNLEPRVIALIAKKKKLDPATITAASTFEQLGVDSLDAADMLFAFEDEFKIVVPDEAAQSMRSVGQVVEALRGILEKGARA
jgi:acyl carrier protein